MPNEIYYVIKAGELYYKSGGLGDMFVMRVIDATKFPLADQASFKMQELKLKTLKVYQISFVEVAL